MTINNTTLRFLNEEEAKKVEEFKNNKLKQLNLNKEEEEIKSIDNINKEEVYLNAIYDKNSVLREIKVSIPNDDNFKSTMLSLLDKLIM